MAYLGKLIPATAPIVLVAAMLAPIARAGEPAATPPATALVSSRIGARVIKRFDFAEDKIGNFESTPMNWRQVVGPGYPRFTEPTLDRSAGHAAPPSFKLAVSGESLGCEYWADDIPVHPDSDYEISGWIRAEKVKAAQAGLSAYFLDHAHRPIEASRVTYELPRDAAAMREWTKLRVELSGRFPEARWIGLEVHLRQPGRGVESPERPRPIRRVDARAAAWFDDLEIVRLPTVTLSLTNAAHVLRHGETSGCRVRVADVDANGLSAELRIVDAEGGVVRRETVPVVDMRGPTQSIELGGLPAGYYTLWLTASVGEQTLVSREQTFVQLPDDLDARPAASALGIVLKDAAHAHPELVSALCDALDPGWVKLDLWKRETSDRDIVRGDPGDERLVDVFYQAGRKIVAVLDGPPATLTAQLGHPRHSVLDVLAQPPKNWRPYAAFVFARYGERVRGWQLGGDRAAGAFREAQGRVAMKNAEQELEPLVGRSPITLPRSARTDFATAASGGETVLSCVVDHGPAERMEAQLAGLTDQEQAWVTLLGPKGPLVRTSRLAEFARRIVMARGLGADVVFVEQPWTLLEDRGEKLARPSEEFLIARTLAQAIGVRRRVAEPWLGHGLYAALFAEEGEPKGVLFVWREADGDTPQAAAVEAAEGLRAFDAWGRRQALHVESALARFEVGATPTIVCGIDVLRVRTAASFRVEPAEIGVTVEPAKVKWSLKNAFASRLVGRLRLAAPQEWELSPMAVEVDAAPGAKVEGTIDVSLPMNQANGPFSLAGILESADRAMDGLQLRAPLSVAAAGLDVEVLTREEDGRLHIFQRVTNRAKRPLDLRCTAIIPHQAMQTRFIRRLPSGRTALRDYTVETASLAGAEAIRVSVEEVDGELRNHQLIRLK